MVKVNAAKRLGISACQITHFSLIEDANLLRNTAQGKYELICVSPEWAIPENKQFATMINSAQLKMNLLGVIVDESHLCFVWYLPSFLILRIIDGY